MKQQKLSGFTHIEVIMVIVVVAILGLLGFVYYGNYIQKDDLAQQSNSKDNHEKSVSVDSGVLVFQSSNSSNSKMLIVGSDGKVQHEIVSDVNSSKYQHAGLGFIDGSFFLTNNQAKTDFAAASYDGSSRQVSKIANSYLSDSVVDYYTKRESQHSIHSYVAIDKDVIIALTEEPDAYKLISINLANGNISTLLTVKAISNNHGYGYVPIGIGNASTDGNLIYLLSDDANINTTDMPGYSLIAYNISTNKFTAKTMPSNITISPSFDSVSKNGKLVAYQKSYANHILDIDTGSDIVCNVEMTPFNAVEGGYFSFSHDSKYVAMVGSPSGDAINDLSEIQIVSTLDGKVAQTIDLPDTSSSDDNIAIAGWLNDHVLVYYSFKITSDINTSGLSSTVHSIDAATGKIIDYPSNLGYILTILN